MNCGETPKNVQVTCAWKLDARSWKLEAGSGCRGLSCSLLPDPCSLLSPRAFNPEGIEIRGFGVVEVVLDEAVDPAASGSAAKAGAQFGQVFLFARRHHFNLTLFGIAHPSEQVKLAGLPVDIPPEAHPLYSALNQKMKDHGRQPKPVLQIGVRDATRTFACNAPDFLEQFAQPLHCPAY